MVVATVSFICSAAHTHLQIMPLAAVDGNGRGGAAPAAAANTQPKLYPGQSFWHCAIAHSSAALQHQDAYALASGLAPVDATLESLLTAARRGS